MAEWHRVLELRVDPAHSLACYFGDGSRITHDCRNELREQPIAQLCCYCTKSWPFEIVSYILDFLHSDKTSLLSCSLVSHQWRSAAKFHLFGTIALPRPCHYYLELTTKLVADENSFLRNIRSLAVAGPACMDPAAHSADETQYLLDIIAALPRLQTLDIDASLPHKGSFVETIREPRRTLFKLRRLRFGLQSSVHRNLGSEDESARYTNCILNLLGLFSEINSLVLPSLPRDTEVIYMSEYIQKVLPRYRQTNKLLLREVTVDNAFWCDRTLVAWCQILHHICQPSRLENAHITYIVHQYEVPPPLGTALSYIGRSLRVLRLNLLSIIRDRESYRARITLQACSRLQHLYLENREHGQETPNPNDALSWETFCAIIDSLPPAANDTLESIKIHWNFKGALSKIYQEYYWEPLKNILRRFRALRMVAFADLPSLIRPPHITASMAEGLHRILDLPDHVAVVFLPEGRPFKVL